ncbi:hypothetical protein Plim_0234 [Planctopirus limnophila DSM 3776]|uniref:Pyrrolo-quinoline quinone repeat domain-containing protein n=1 Tax=Planctopirus limnophila (strain ATCC 43296 / DSM 3776 / IFAM 1008 / Mu 290) TaxID=521674 RepID=D5SNT1_PLAL2|nr:PQQ-binding-like beta-propeller repeat protein [Planctopirus limnophila]ADG66086.1 hypothetical protein Plim_0234 [Planctopirus limnophila DSM 3776]
MASDQELLQLVQEKTAEEFTAAEIALLRQRLPFSPELQQALSANLSLQEALSTHYASIDLSVEKILLRAADKRQNAASQNVRQLKLLVGFLAIAMLVGAGALFWPKVRNPLANNDLLVEEGQPEDRPAEPTPQTQATIDAAKASEAQLLAQNRGEKFDTTSPQGVDPKSATGKSDPAMTTPNQPVEGAMTTAQTVPVVPAAEVVVAAPPPWSEWLPNSSLPDPEHPAAIERQPVSYRESVFAADLATMQLDSLQQNRFNDWLGPVAGRRADLHEHNHQKTRTVQVNGLARLKAPWFTNSCLRLAMFDVNELSINVWSGKKGIQLRYFPHRQPAMWVAVDVKRSGPDEAIDRKAAGEQFLGTDGSAWSRLGQGTIDLTWHEGKLLLIKQRAVLLEVPFENCPEQIELDGQYRLRGLDYLRVTDVPRRDPLGVLATLPDMEAVQPKTLEWEPTKDSRGELQQLESGAVLLTGNSREQPAEHFAKLPYQGFFDVSVQLNSATRGTGIYLGNSAGKPVVTIQVHHNRRTGRNVVQLGHPHHGHDEVDYDPQHQPLLHLGEKQWWRLIGHSAGVMLFTSADGRTWSPVPDGYTQDLPLEPVATIGLQCLRGEAARAIEIGQLIIRPAIHIESIVDRSLLAKLANEGPRPELTPSLSEAKWSEQVETNCPVGTNPEEWWFANAYWSLTQPIYRELSRKLQSRLINQIVMGRRPAVERLKAMAWLLPLQHAWDEWRARELAGQFGQIAADTVDQPAWPDLDESLILWANTPLWTHTTLWNGLVRRDSKALNTAALLGSASEQLKTSHELLARWDLTHPDQNPPYQYEMLVKRMRWLQALSSTSGDAPVLSRSWRHPLLLQLSKEGYNASAELQAALDGEAFLDGCRVIASLVSTDQGELLPVATDPDLFVSLPAAIDRVMKQYPSLLAVMRDQMGSTGDVRIRQAMADGNIISIRNITLQFPQTMAAAQAHLWLGDRALSAGQWQDAIEHFAKAGAIPDSTLEDAIQLRQWLLGAKLPDRFDPEKTLLRLRDDALQGTSWAGLVQTREFLKQNVWGEAETTARNVALQPVPAVANSWESQVVFPFDPPAGKDADRSEYRQGDLWTRQLACLETDHQLILHHRSRTVALDRATLNRKWQSDANEEPGSAIAYSHLPFNPVQAGSHLYVRRLVKEGVELAALDLESGEIRWTYRGGNEGSEDRKVSVLSDGWYLFSRLGVIVERPVESDAVSIEWHVLDARSGKLLESVPLIRIRDVLPGQFSITSTISDQKLWITAPGLSACITHRGEILWLRRHVWVPRSIDTREFNKILNPPARVGDLVLVEPPGVSGVIAMHAESGAVQWTLPIDGLIGRLGIVNSLWIGRSTDGLIAIDWATGKIVWQTSMNELVDAVALDEEQLLVARRSRTSKGKKNLEIVWLDPRSGTILGQGTMEIPQQDEYQLGQLFSLDQRILGWAGVSNKRQRELIEITPQNNSPDSTKASD